MRTNYLLTFLVFSGILVSANQYLTNVNRSIPQKHTENSSTNKLITKDSNNTYNGNGKSKDTFSLEQKEVAYYQNSKTEIEEYYNSLIKSEHDSVKKWTADYGFLDETIELSVLIKKFGKHFYRIKKELIIDSLFSNYWLSNPDQPNTCDYWDKKLSSIYSHNNSLVDATYKSKFPSIKEFIWNENSIIIDLKPLYLETWIERFSDTQLKIKINELENKEKKYGLHTLKNGNTLTEILNHVKNKTENINTNNELFLIALKLYKIYCYDSIPQILKLIDKNLQDPNNLIDYEDKATWYLGLAKMYSSIDLKYQANQIIFCLKKAETYIEKSGILLKKEKRIKINVIRSDFWNKIDGGYITLNSSLRVLYDGYLTNIENLEYKQKQCLISRIIKNLGEWIIMEDYSQRKVNINEQLRISIFFYLN